MKNVTMARYMVKETTVQMIAPMARSAISFLPVADSALFHCMSATAINVLAADISGPSSRKPSISAKIGEAT